MNSLHGALGRTPHPVLVVSASPKAGAFSVAYPQKRAGCRPAPPAWAWPAVAGVALLLVVLLARHHGRAAAAAPQRFVLVMDAGSSGTRIYAYQWRPPSQAGGLPSLTAVEPSAAAHKVPRKLTKGLYTRVETETGLQHFVGDAVGLRQTALQPLLDWAAAVVPAHVRSQVPLFLMATGGTRRLPLDQQEALMADARTVLASSGFRFEPQWARVISGTQEGAYGWVALNYLEGALHAASAAHTGTEAAASGPLKTLAALDMGGSTLEVTFEAAVSAADSAQHEVFTTNVAGMQHKLFTHSFKHYGLNEAFDRGVSLLITQQYTPAAAAPAAEVAAAPTAPKEPAAVDVAPDAAVAGAGIVASSFDGSAVAPTIGSISSSSGANSSDLNSSGANSSSSSSSSDNSSDNSSTVTAPVEPQPGVSMPLRLARRALLAARAAAAARGASRADWAEGWPGTGPTAETARAAAAAMAQLGISSASSGGGVLLADVAARRRLAAATELPVVRHPCLHRGYSQRYERIVFGDAAPSPTAVQLEGAPDWHACAALARTVVNATAPCQRQHGAAEGLECRLGSLQPRLPGEVMALTGFYVVWTFFGLQPTAKLHELLAASQQLCSRPWADVHASLGSHTNTERFCMWGPYMAELLQQGLGLDERSVRIGSGSIGWPLGAALAEGSQLPELMALQPAAAAAGQAWWAWLRGAEGALFRPWHGLLALLVLVVGVCCIRFCCHGLLHAGEGQLLPSYSGDEESGLGGVGAGPVLASLNTARLRASPSRNHLLFC